MSSFRFLIVDDDRAFGEFVARVAADIGFDVRVTERAGDCLSELSRAPPDLLLIDLQMPGIDGVQLMRQLAMQGVASRLLLASGVDPRTLASAKRLAEEHGLDVVGTVQKPVRAAEMRRLLRSLRYPSGEADILSEQTLSNAIEEDVLTVAYQPQFDLRRRKLTSVEALARWRTPSGIEIPPDRFVALAESSGLIDRLTDRILDRAVRQAQRWALDGLELKVAVNLSVASLHDLSFPDKLAERCEAVGLSPERLRFELTETATMQSTLPILDILTRIRLKGFDLSLDDFGVGFSSLQRLQRLPFSELKIDRTFVRDLGSTAESAVITKTIVDMAHNLGMTVVAEGIESGVALRTLESFGCDFGQGYLFSPAVPGEDVADLTEVLSGETWWCGIRPVVAE